MSLLGLLGESIGVTITTIDSGKDENLAYIDSE
jgi:hypothetical protein